MGQIPASVEKLYSFSLPTTQGRQFRDCSLKPKIMIEKDKEIDIE